VGGTVSQKGLGGQGMHGVGVRSEEVGLEAKRAVFNLRP